MFQVKRTGRFSTFLSVSPTKRYTGCPELPNLFATIASSPSFVKNQEQEQKSGEGGSTSNPIASSALSSISVLLISCANLFFFPEAYKPMARAYGISLPRFHFYLHISHKSRNIRLVNLARWRLSPPNGAERAVMSPLVHRL